MRYYLSLRLKNKSRTLSGIPRFTVKGLSKILGCYFVLIWWQKYKKQENLKQSCKDLFILAAITITKLIIRSDNIFNVEVNGAFAMIMHNMLTQNHSRLNFG